MIENSKQLFEAEADKISGWREMNKNALCDLYIDNENNSLGNAYLSAIICRYWGNIYKCYSQSQGYATKEDCYDVLIDAIQNILKRRSWRNPASKLYGDPNGADKAINRCIKTTWINLYTAAMRQKRVCNTQTIHIDELDAPVVDAMIDKVVDTALQQRKDSENVVVNGIVKDLFSIKDYVGAFAVDLIIHGDVFLAEIVDDETVTEFSTKKLIKYIHYIDNDYVDFFCDEYEISRSSVEVAVAYVKNQSSDVLAVEIARVLAYVRDVYFPCEQRKFEPIDETGGLWG